MDIYGRYSSFNKSVPFTLPKLASRDHLPPQMFIEMRRISLLEKLES